MYSTFGDTGMVFGTCGNTYPHLQVQTIAVIWCWWNWLLFWLLRPIYPKLRTDYTSYLILQGPPNVNQYRYILDVFLNIYLILHDQIKHIRIFHTRKRNINIFSFYTLSKRLNFEFQLKHLEGKKNTFKIPVFIVVKHLGLQILFKSSEVRWAFETQSGKKFKF